jgi:hypothetical protein
MTGRTRTKMLLTATIVAVALLDAGGAAADPAGCVDSPENPIRVCYDFAEDQTMAEEALDMAELFWDVLIDRLGFSVPWRLDDEGNPEDGFDLLITDIGAYAAGYAEPLADVPSTPRSDCAVRLNISRNNAGHNMEMVISHEMGQKVQMADDCAERPHEGQVPYIGMLVIKYSEVYPYDAFLESISDFFFSSFQANPAMALDFASYYNPDLAYYHFGHCVFDMYLDERWGGETGTIIADISRASRQDGTIVISGGVGELESGDNEPDLYAAVDAVLAGKGGSFWEAVKGFSVWRLFTGDLADGDHLRHGDLIAPVAFDTSYAMSELPVADASPVTPPAETGSSYISLGVDPARVTSPDDLLQLDLASTESMNWYLAAVVFEGDGSSRLVEAPDLTEGLGSLAVNDLAAAQSVVFIATNLGDLSHASDGFEFSGSPFSYDLDFWAKPVILAVTPPRIVQGTEASIEIAGSGFKPGIQADLGDGLTVTEATVDGTGGKITAAVAAAEDAPVGWHALTLSYANGLEASSAEGIEVLTGRGPELISVSPDTAYPGDAFNVELAGERFRAGMTVEIAGAGVSVGRVDVMDDGSAIAGLTVDETAPPGPRDVTVTNPDGKSFTLEGGFTVLSAEDAATDDDGGDVDHDGEAGGCGCSMVM